MNIRQQYQKVSRLLSQSVKLRVRQAAPLYLERTRSLQESHSLHQTAIAVLKLQFPASLPAETEVLAFYLLGFVALADQKDSLAEMDEQQQILKLQMAMNRQSKFNSTLSNILKKIANTHDSIIQNLR